MAISKSTFNLIKIEQYLMELWPTLYLDCFPMIQLPGNISAIGAHSDKEFDIHIHVHHDNI